MTLVDTNVLLDIVTRDQNWWAWSLAQLESAAVNGRLVINEVVYAECSVRFSTIESLETVLDHARCEILRMPKAALFLAGKVSQRYRVAGGSRTGVLPDFFVGAHAAVLEIPVLSRDARRFRTYFPTVTLITPHAA